MTALPDPSTSSLRAPSGALYLITIPLALVWAGGRRLFNWIGDSLLLWAVVALFTLTFLLVAGYMALMFGLSNYFERYWVLNVVENTMWHGYLDTLRIPRLFDGSWREAMETIYRTTETVQHNQWPEYMGSWYRHAEFRTVVVTTAARHGLGVVLVFLAYRLVRWVFR